MLTRDEKSDSDIIDLEMDDDTEKATQRVFNIKIKDKNYVPIEKSIKSKKIQIYEILKKRILRPKDFIISRNKINPLFNTEKTKRIKKNPKFSELYKKIEFGNLDYIDNHSYQEGTKNKDLLHKRNKISLLNSRNFNFRSGFEHLDKKSNKQKDNKEKTNLKKLILNKTALNTFGFKKKLKKKTTFGPEIDNNNNELNKNYYNIESLNILTDNNYTRNRYNTIHNNRYNNRNTDRYNTTKCSKELSLNSESTPKNNTAINKSNKSNFKIDKISKTYSNFKILKMKSINKANAKISKDVSNSQISGLESDSEHENKYIKSSRHEKNKTKAKNYFSKECSLKKLIFNCLNNKNNKKKPKSLSNKNEKAKYDSMYRKSFILKHNMKLLKSFEKYYNLINRDNDDNLSTNNKTNDIFSKSKKIEKEKTINKNFCKYGSKIISSLITDINSDQLELNNKLFKIIDRTNVKIKKEKKLDDVLEVILNRKLIKKKRIKAKEIYVDASDGKKLMEERNRLRFMMRFADLIKNMKDEIALKYTNNIIDKNKSKRIKEFNWADLTEYKKRREERYKEEQKAIRNRLMDKILEIEKRIKTSEIEKDNLYIKYDSVFEKNKKLDEDEYFNSLKIQKGEKKYHDIDFILNQLI